MPQKKCSVCEKIHVYEGDVPSPFRCSCGTIRWDKPLMEAQLFTLQEKYLENRDNKILGEMYKILFKYSKNMIWSRVKNKYSMSEDKIESKAQDASTAIIQYYLTKPYFMVNESFGSYVVGAVSYQLYYKKIKDIDEFEVSLSTPLGSDQNPGKEATLEDKLSERTTEDVSSFNEYFDEDKEERLIEEMDKFLEKSLKHLAIQQGVRQAVYSFSLLHSFLNQKPDKFFEWVYSEKGRTLQENFELLKLSLFEFLEEVH